MISIEEILGSDGRIAKRLDNFEMRQQQIDMARAVEEAVADKKHLIVEAGTGVGKSFGYLVPAILSLAASQSGETESKRRIVVSTHTISLQEQLIAKDIPFLNSVIPLEFSAVLGKGRGNYVSLRRLSNAIAKSDTLFSSEDEHFQIQELSKWSKSTTGGSRSELEFRLLSSVWDEVQSDTSNCMRRKCASYADCHYFRARNRLKHADIIVVNHALFFVDLAMRQSGINLLPDYDMVVLDEAHTVRDVASAHLGISLSSGQVDYALNRLFNDRRNKGLFVSKEFAEGQRQVIRCREASAEFFGDIASWSARMDSGSRGSKRSIRVKEQGIVANQLSPALSTLAEMTAKVGQSCTDANDKLNFQSSTERLQALASEIETWRIQSADGQVYWIESSTNRYGRDSVKLASSPIDVGPLLNRMLFSQVDTAILTSATIAVGENSFDYFQNQLGLTNAMTKKLGSPFNYSRQAKLIVVPNMADPSSDKETHERQSIGAIRRFVEQTDGHAFVLCTSYSFLNRAVSELTPWLTDHNYAIYSQGSGVDRSQLLENFKKNPRGVLFGTDSFWQGVDVQGDALQNVIIPKLPFSVPDQPLLQARLEAIRQRGGNPFNEHQLPEAIIKFKQGFGRLIRSHLDTGIVVILDPRIGTKRYGRSFLNSLPECPIEQVVL